MLIKHAIRPTTGGGAAAPVNTSPPSISGTATEGQTITITRGTWTNSPTSYDYALWSVGPAVLLHSVTYPTFALVAGDVGKTVEVRETANNAGGSAVAGSNDIGPVASSVLAPTNTTPPSISGTAFVNVSITITPGTWANSPTSFSYALWNVPANTLIRAVTSPFTLLASEEGLTVEVRETATNTAGSGVAGSNDLGPIVNVPVNITPPTISGLPNAGETITIDRGTWTNSPTVYTHTLYNVTTGTIIRTVTYPTFALVAGDVGKTVEVRVAGINGAGSGVAVGSNDLGPIEAAIVIPVNVTPPVISGTPTEGQSITITPGTWTNSPTTITFALWDVAGGGTLLRAVTSPFTLLSSDVGLTVAVRETATNAFGSATEPSNAAGPIASSAVPANTTLPTLTGDLEQGGTLIVTPGTWTNAISYEYRILKGTVSAPAAGPVVLLDWTTDTEDLVVGISDGDYLWLQEKATGPGGNTTVTAAAGHGPMEALAAADAVIIGGGGLNTATTASAVTYSFDMNITDTPSRGLILMLHCQGTAGASNPTWNSVTAEGVSLNFVEAFTFLDPTGSRSVFVEIWELWGNTLPVGPLVTISASRTLSSIAMRSTLCAVAIGNTQPSPPTDADCAIYSSVTDLDTYSFTDTTTEDKQLVIAFPIGQWLTGTVPSPVFTPGASWTTAVDPWPGTRNASSQAWNAAMYRVIPTIASYSVGYNIEDSSGTQVQRYGVVPLVRIKGDNS